MFRFIYSRRNALQKRYQIELPNAAASLEMNSNRLTGECDGEPIGRGFRHHAEAACLAICRPRWL